MMFAPGEKKGVDVFLFICVREGEVDLAIVVVVVVII